MAAWLWLKGIPGPPANEDWFEALSYQIGEGRTAPIGRTGSRDGRDTEFSFTVPFDSASAALFDAYVTGRVIPQASIFLEPQTRYSFTNCVLLSASSGAGSAHPMNCRASCETMKVDFGK